MPAPTRQRRGKYRQDASGLVAWAIDLFEQTYDAVMPKRTMDTFSKQLKDMLEEGVEWRVLYEAVRLCVERGRGASALADTIIPATKRVEEYAGLRPSQIEAAREFVKEGWPTGARFVRGSHSGTYVPDPLGRDRPPSGLSFERPTLRTIAVALGHKRGER